MQWIKKQKISGQSLIIIFHKIIFFLLMASEFFDSLTDTAREALCSNVYFLRHMLHASAAQSIRRSCWYFPHNHSYSCSMRTRRNWYLIILPINIDLVFLYLHYFPCVLLVRWRPLLPPNWVTRHDHLVPVAVPCFIFIAAPAGIVRHSI